MAKIYLPTVHLNRPCKVINENYIRVYHTTNQGTGVTNTVTDIYFKSDYITRQTTASYTTSILCDSTNTYTDDFYYRYDFTNILINFLIMSIIMFVIPVTIYKRFFRRS